MILQTKEKEIFLRPTTKKIIELTEQYNKSNLSELYFEALSKQNNKMLTVVIFKFAEDKAGQNSFETIEEVYDFIDNYRKENNKSYNDIFVAIAEMVNDEGFFQKKMTQEELREALSSPSYGIEYMKVVQNATEKAIEKIAEKEFLGYQA